MNHAVSEVFAALADTTRRALYEQLLASEHGATATQLADGARISRQAIVKHLQILARCGLARVERDGRDVRYLATPEGTRDASMWLRESSAAWDRRIAALEEKIRSSRPQP